MSLSTRVEAAIRHLSANRRHLLDYIASTGSLATGLVAQTVAFIILARSLGAEQYGLMTIVLTAATLGLMCCGLGSGEMMRRRVARDPAEYPRALGHAICILGLTSTVIAVITTAVLAHLVVVHPDPIRNVAVLFALVVSAQGLTAWISLAEKIFLAFNEYRAANLVNVGSGIARVLTVSLACLAFGVADVKGWAAWQLGSSLVMAGLCAVAIAPYGAPRLGVLRDEIGKGLTISLSSLLISFRQNVDILVLSSVVSPSVIGLYGVARSIVAMASVVSHSFDRLVYSRLVVAGAKGAGATLDLAKRYAGMILPITLATSIALYLVAPLLPIAVGQQYAGAAPMLQVLCWMLCLTGLQFLAADSLNAADKHKARFASEGIFNGLGAAIVAILTLQFALPGMLAALYISSILIVAALWLTLWRHASAETTKPKPGDPAIGSPRSA